MRRKRSHNFDARKKNIVRALFFLNAILWLVYTVFIYLDMAVANHNGLAANIVTVYVFVNAAVMFVSGLGLGNQRKPAFYFALVVVILNTILTVLNISDLVFIIAFILDVIILWLLISIRDAYLLKP